MDSPGSTLYRPLAVASCTAFTFAFVAPLYALRKTRIGHASARDEHGRPYTRDHPTVIKARLSSTALSMPACAVGVWALARHSGMIRASVRSFSKLCQKDCKLTVWKGYLSLSNPSSPSPSSVSEALRLSPGCYAFSHCRLSSLQRCSPGHFIPPTWMATSLACETSLGKETSATSSRHGKASETTLRYALVLSI